MKTRPGTLYNSFWCQETIAFVVKSLRFTVYSILEKVTYIKDFKDRPRFQFNIFVTAVYNGNK